MCDEGCDCILFGDHSFIASENKSIKKQKRDKMEMLEVQMFVM